MRNLLQPIWMKPEHQTIKAAIEGRNSNTTPRKLMDVIDSFKSIGFDHTRQQTYEEFVKRLTELRSQGLTAKIDEILDSLAQLGVLENLPQQGSGKFIIVSFGFGGMQQNT
jgi:hypothetical protein